MNPQQAVGEKTEAIYKLMCEVRKLKADNPGLRLGNWSTPGSILNAYREGDLGFLDAVAALEQWKART